MLRLAPFAGLVLLLTLITVVIIGWFGHTESQGKFIFSDTVAPILFTVALILVVGVGLMVILLFARAQGNAMERKIARYSPQHGCTCTWCGRETVPLANSHE